MYYLENHQVYKPKLPFFNKYKNPAGAFHHFLVKIAAVLEPNTQAHWQLPEDVRSYMDSLYATNPIRKRTDDMVAVHQKMLAFKQTFDGTAEDAAFYADAAVYTLGLAMKEYAVNRSEGNLIMLLADYFLDIPYDLHEQLFEAVTKGGSYFETYVPSSFGLWPKIRSSGSNPAYDSRCIALFDYMTERAFFSLRTTKDAKTLRFVQEQILCYYKFLVSNRIYLPKAIQARVTKLGSMSL